MFILSAEGSWEEGVGVRVGRGEGAIAELLGLCFYFVSIFWCMQF